MIHLLYYVLSFFIIDNVLLPNSRYPFILFLLLLLMVDYCRHKPNISKEMLKSLILPVALYVTMLCSAVFNHMFELFFKASLVFAVFLIGFILSQSDSQKIWNRVMTVTLVNHAVLVLISLIATKGDISIPFTGHYPNPNTMGMMLLVLCLALLSKLDIARVSRSSLKKLSIPALVISLLLSIILLLLTNNRSSVLTLALMIGSVLLTLLPKLRYLSKKQCAYIALFLGLGGLLCLNFGGSELITETIVSKNQRRSSDLTTGRLVVWQDIISQMNLFGHGKGAIHVRNIHSAHNTFFAVLSEFGLIPMIIYIVITLITLFKSVLYAFKAKTDALIPLMVSVTFITSSMFEVNLFKWVMVLMTFNYFYLYNYQEESGIINDEKTN